MRTALSFVPSGLRWNGHHRASQAAWREILQRGRSSSNRQSLFARIPTVEVSPNKTKSVWRPTMPVLKPIHIERRIVMATPASVSAQVAALVFDDQAANENKLICAPDLARALDVSPRVVCRLVGTGQLEGVRFSQRDIRIPVRSVRSFLKGGGVRPCGNRRNRTI